MAEVSADMLDIISEFTAVEHIEDRHIPLEGPEVLYSYKSPQRGVEQGVLCIFKAEEEPLIVIAIEHSGDRIRVQSARLTDERVEIFHKGNMFTNLANNYVDQML